MPPRFAYWTILIDDKATAFRARERDELLPTFNQLKRTNQNVVMKWFARGRLWESREESWAAARPPVRERPEKRGKDWRPGGQHKDPRARFDKKKRPFAQSHRDARRDARRPDARRPDDRRPDDRRPDDRRPDTQRPDDRRSHDSRQKDARGKKPDQRQSRDRWRKDARARKPGGKPFGRDKRPRGDRPDRPPKPDRPPQHDDRPERREPEVPTPPTETPEPPPSPERIVGNRKSEN
jgi:hypothetical protein